MSEPITAEQSSDINGHVCYRALGRSAPTPALLAELLGVHVDRLALTVDPELWAKEQKLARRRPRGPVRNAERAWDYIWNRQED
jgi:hypothetical protein